MATCTCRSGCNVCNNCDQHYKYQCDMAQKYCGAQPETAVGNAYDKANVTYVQRDDIIYKKFPQSELNRLIDYIINAGKYESGTNGEDRGNGPTNSGLSCAHEDRDFVYADKIMELIGMMKTLNSKNDPGLSFERDDIIYADDFNEILKKIDGLYLNTTGCPMCISSCNVDCNNCINCVSCYGKCCCNSD